MPRGLDFDNRTFIGVFFLIPAFALRYLMSFLLSCVTDSFECLNFRQVADGVFGALSWILPFAIFGFLSGIFSKEKRNKPIPVMIFLSLFFLCYFIANGISYISEAFLSEYGYTYASYDFSGYTEINYLLFVLISALIVPVSEEFAFRKVVLLSLLPFGNVLAVVISSMSFALCHDVSTMGYSFVFGLFLGFLALKFGHIYAVAVHILNNLISSVLIVAKSCISDEAGASLSVVQLVVMTVFAAVSLIYLIKSRLCCEKKS